MLASLSGAAPKSSRASSLLRSGHIFGRPRPRRCDCGCKHATCRSELAREPFRRSPEELASKLAPTVRSCTWPVQRGLVLAEADAIAERIMDFQHLTPALLNNLGASVAVAFALQFVLQQLDIVHRHKDR